jgi:hypothetical protein
MPPVRVGCKRLENRCSLCRRQGYRHPMPYIWRAVQFLLNTQQDDVSWYVRTRAMAFQPYFDVGFPHGFDQWISAAGASGAALALSQASPARTTTASLGDRSRDPSSSIHHAEAGRRHSDLAGQAKAPAKAPATCCRGDCRLVGEPLPPDNRFFHSGCSRRRPHGRGKTFSASPAAARHIERIPPAGRDGTVTLGP